MGNCRSERKAAILTQVSKSKIAEADSLFRELLKELRLAQNITQVQLARRLRRPQSYVSKFENGERRLDFVETVFLCDALGVKLENVARTFSRRFNAVRRHEGDGLRGGK